MNKKIKHNEICMLRVLENKKYPGGRFVTCDVLVHPSINDKNFDDVNKEDWVWEERMFPHPLFKNQKNGDVFLVKLETTSEHSYIGIHEDSVLLEKAEKLFVEHDEYMDQKFKELSERMEKSGFFKNNYEKEL